MLGIIGTGRLPGIAGHADFHRQRDSPQERHAQRLRGAFGAALPEGADTIVIQEDTERDGDRIAVTDKPKEQGEFVRPAGLDFSEGEVLLSAGRVVTARDVGLAAAMNRPWLMVRRRPRVGSAGCSSAAQAPPLLPHHVLLPQLLGQRREP